MNTLVIGGTSGLGLEIGTLLLDQDGAVYVTGRVNRVSATKLRFLQFTIGTDARILRTDLDHLVASLPHIDLLVYAAGFYEQGRIDELSDEHILTMLNVGETAPMFLLQRLLKKQSGLGGFIAVTSTSQWTPREKEPLYTAVKAGLGKFAESLSLDPRVKKTLVAGPAGMDTGFWDGTSKDATGMLSPVWVARQTLELWSDSYTYRLARILRNPQRVQILETRT